MNLAGSQPLAKKPAYWPGAAAPKLRAQKQRRRTLCGGGGGGGGDYDDKCDGSGACTAGVSCYDSALAVKWIPRRFTEFRAVKARLARSQ